MSDDRLTPEVQAVLDAAVRYVNSYEVPNRFLAEAVAAYLKATAPPEPFEVLVGYQGDQVGWIDDDSRFPNALKADRIWRCTVTPVERVR